MKNNKDMLKAIKKIKSELLKASKAKGIAANAARDALKKVGIPKCLKKDMILAEQSKELTTIEHDEYLHQWVRLSDDSIAFIEELKAIDADKYLESELADILQEEGYTLDFQNDALTYSIGPCVIVSCDRGKVTAYDQDTCKNIAVLDRVEGYESELYPLIESWMDKGGYFTSVVSVNDRGQDYRYLNTQEYKQTG